MPHSDQPQSLQRCGLIPILSSATPSALLKERPMRTEIEKTVAEIEQVLTLLRRHL
jgi:hypothetical protein